MKTAVCSKAFLFLSVLGLFSASDADAALFNGFSIKPGNNSSSLASYSKVITALEQGNPQVLIIEYHTNQATGQMTNLQQRLADFNRVKASIQPSFAQSDIQVARDFSHLPMSVVQVNGRQGLQQLMRQPQIKAVYENGINKLFLAQSLPLIDQPEAAALGFTGAGTAVAVLDTGVDYTRSAFGSCTAPGLPESTCKVAFAQDFTPTDDGERDADGHGTNVAGISLGVAPGTQILALDVFRGSSGYDSDIIAAINWSIANQAAYNIAAINMSLGDGVNHTAVCPSDSFAMPIGEAKAAGIFVAVASGNDAYTNGIGSPACTPDAISVGAVYDANVGGISTSVCVDSSTAADQVACFSNSATFLDLLAPGAMITAAGFTMGGTSQATPHVAGAAAVLAEAFPAESADDWLSRLQATGTPVLDGRNAITKPRIDLDDAVSSSVLPSLSISDVSADEGGNLVFTVIRSDDTTDITVNYNTLDGTATSTVDYPTGQTGSVSFSAGNGVLSKTITITTTEDSTVELDETFTVELFSVTGAFLSDSEGVGTIQNDDSATVSIDDVIHDEGDSGTTSYSFTLSLSAPVDTLVSVDTATAGDTAISGADFYAVSGPSVLIAGSLQQTFNVNVQGETLVELNEQFLVNLSNLDASGREVTIVDNQGVGGITNDDAATVTIVDAEKTEGDSGTSMLAFDVQLNNKVDTDVAIEFNTANGLAVAPGDFTAATGATVTIPAGLQNAPVEIQLQGDLTVEQDEQFQVNLSNPAAAGRDITLGDVQAIGSILNDDSAILSIGDVNMKEGNEGVSVFQLAVSLSNPVDTLVSVDYLSADASATTVDGDYTTATGTTNFAAGDQQQTIEVTVSGDAVVELDEQFLLNLSNLGHGGRAVMLGDVQAQALIENDDSATISIDDVSHEEGDAGSTNYDFTVSLSAPVDASATLDIATADDTAISPDDYFALNGKMTIGKGILQKLIRVQVTGDTDTESDEQFLLDLSNLSVAGRDVSFLKSQGIGQIINDDFDATPGVTLVPFETTMLTSEDGDTALFTLVLDSEPGGNVSFSFESSRPDEGTVNPTTASFDAGNWDDVRTVTITGEDDDFFDGNQLYQVTASITASADTDYPAGYENSLEITNLDNNADCTGVNLVLRPQDVPDGAQMECMADISIVFDQGSVRIERGSEAQEARVELTAPAISVPLGHALGVERNSILIMRSPPR